jgi:PilZ domain
MQVNKQESSKVINAVVPERRRAQRFRVRWAVTVRGVDAKGRLFDEAGYLQNLSSTGALMILPSCPSLDSRLSLRVTIPLKKRSCIGYSARVSRVEGSKLRVAVALVFDNQRPSFTDNQ